MNWIEQLLKSVGLGLTPGSQGVPVVRIAGGVVDPPDPGAPWEVWIGTRDHQDLKLCRTGTTEVGALFFACLNCQDLSQMAFHVKQRGHQIGQVIQWDGLPFVASRDWMKEKT